MEVSFGGWLCRPRQSPVAGRGGRARFTWLDGGFVDRALHGRQSHRAGGIAIIGPGATAETFCRHYYDSRGVVRICQVSLNDGVWRLWREAPGFWQRCIGVFCGGGRTVKGAWEG